MHMRVSVFKMVLALADISAACLFLSAVASAQLTPQQAAGKQLYLQGTSPSGGTVEAILSEGTTRVPARLMPCGSCHGADGRGRPEGGVVPPDITWEALARPSVSDNPLARRRPAYDIDSLRRAITKGVDPAGNRLGVAMPVYRLSPLDLDNLTEYLRLVGNEPEPGITAEAIRIGAIVPAKAEPTADNSNPLAVLQAYFDELNQQGGIYNRKIELLAIPVASTPTDILRQAKEVVEHKKIFALLIPFAPVSEREVGESLEHLEVPAIVSFAPNADTDWSEQSRVFFVLSGLFQQTNILVKFAHEHREPWEPAPVIVYPENMQTLADSTATRYRSIAQSDVMSVKYETFDAAVIAEPLSRQNVRTVFFLGNGRELQQLLEAAGKFNWEPTILQPGPLAGQAFFHLSEQSIERVFLAFPTLPSDLEPEALQEFMLLLRKHNLSTPHPALSLTALASAKILTEGLRQAGRRLDRAALVSALRRLHDFNTGLTPPVSYSPRRRIGALGGYVVKWDAKSKTFISVEPWLTP